VIIGASQGGSGSTPGSLAADTTPAPTTPKPTPRPPRAVRISLTGSGAYDPQGDRTENDADAHLAVDGNPVTAWRSERYHGTFTKSGIGLVLDAGHAVKANRVVVLSDTPGYNAEIQVGDAATGPFTAVSDSKRVTGRTVYALRPRTGRYLMIWITSMPPGGVAAVNEVTATAAG
jgi:hypothetical protein